ncbi:MAG TPA: response regulator transcription factor [Gaiellaceae bacterium]|nr:response regulator transcription factor [Gaiellaceae bacterium]
MAGPLKLRVLIAAELGLVRDALSSALREEDDITVVGEVPDGEAALAAVAETVPDVVVLNTAMPDHDAVKTSCLIKERAPTCAIVVLGSTQDQRMLEDGLFCGARGYLSKDSSIAEVVEAVRAVAAGDTLIPPVMLGPLLTDLIERRREHEDALMKLSGLSLRERQVLALLSRGARTAEIADRLVISAETARTHVQNMLGKLGVHSRLEAAAIVIENGLLDRLENGSAPRVARASSNGGQG